jgi:CDP-diacylglycerol--glycerol-3-phosphate 3-phosphatidyltransferase/archaetidylinositol phosphate synthase
VEVLLGRLRERYEEAVKPVGLALARRGVSPSLITLLGLAMAAVCSYVLYLGMLHWGLGLLAVIALIDVLDGAVARASGRASGFGRVLDRVADRYAEFALILGLLLGGFMSWPWGLFALFGMLMASYARAEAEAALGEGGFKGGLMERQEKLLALAAGMLIHPLLPGVLDYVAAIVGALSHITAAQRLLRAWRQPSS